MRLSALIFLIMGDTIHVSSCGEVVAGRPPFVRRHYSRRAFVARFLHHRKLFSIHVPPS